MPGVFSGEAKNEAIKRLKELAVWVTVASQTEIAPEASPASRVIKKTGHGLNTGDIVALTQLNGKATANETEGGLVVGRQYYVRKVNANEIELANTKAQAESATVGEHIEFTVEVKATSKLMKLTEHTGAKTKRIKLTYGAEANGQAEDATAREVEASGAVTVDWLMYFTAETAGSLSLVEKVTTKVLAEGDLYKVTSTKLEDLAVA